MCLYSFLDTHPINEVEYQFFNYHFLNLGIEDIASELIEAEASFDAMILAMTTKSNIIRIVKEMSNPNKIILPVAGFPASAVAFVINVPNSALTILNIIFKNKTVNILSINI